MTTFLPRPIRCPHGSDLTPESARHDVLLGTYEDGCRCSSGIPPLFWCGEGEMTKPDGVRIYEGEYLAAWDEALVENKNHFGEYPSYQELVSSFAEILFEDSDDDYQGDSRMVVTDGSRYGYLVFGWGSCSGCDALEAAGSNQTELLELRDQLASGVHWEGSAAELAEYFKAKDWSLDYMPLSDLVKRRIVDLLTLAAGDAVYDEALAAEHAEYLGEVPWTDRVED